MVKKHCFGFAKQPKAVTPLAGNRTALNIFHLSIKKNVLGKKVHAQDIFSSRPMESFP
jgi:hypothetical protein